jgi:hypothetical protein
MSAYYIATDGTGKPKNSVLFYLDQVQPFITRTL